MGAYSIPVKSFRSVVNIVSIIQLLFVLGKTAVIAREATVLNKSIGSVPGFVTRYAPLVWLHSEDPFRPADLLQHIHHTIPTAEGEPIPGLPELNLDNLAILNEVNKNEVALTAADNVSTLPTWLLGTTPDEGGRIHNATPCVVILVEKSPHDMDAFYFYFYSYNRGANFSQLVEPLRYFVDEKKNKMNFGDHVGDWEYNMIRFYDGKPKGIFYSQHEGGAAYDWSSTILSKEDDRPTVFSAYGSHANYPRHGNNVHDAALFDYCDDGMLWDPVLSAYFFRLDPNSSTLNRLSLQGIDTTGTNHTSFVHFTGRWGDTEYSDKDPRQSTIPVLGLKHYVSGPTGPYSKSLLRKGLKPDYQHKSLLQRAVALLMFFYPCCLRGWRVFVSGTVVVLLVASVFYAIRFGVKYYGNRHYALIKNEIPDEDPYELQDLEML